MRHGTRTTLAVIGGCALIGSAVVVGVTSDPSQALAGGGTAPDIQYTQPSVGAMSTGATTTTTAAATTLATSVASPTAKASPLAAECNTSGMCP